MRDILFVLVGGEPVLGGDVFRFVRFFLLLFCVSCFMSSGGARPRCVSMLPKARGICFSSPLWSFPAIRCPFGLFNYDRYVSFRAICVIWGI